MKAPAALPFYLYDFGAIRPDSFLQGDSFKLLEGVQTETVDMVFIDPPYFIKKAEWDTFGNQQEYNDFMARAFWEAERILKPNGTLAFWHNDLQQVARLLCWLENWTQFVFNSWAVWVKPNFRKKLWANPGTGNTLRSWFNIGFLSWNYGVSPPETWIKASRVDVLNSLDTPAVWLSGTGYGKTLYAEGGLRRLDVDNINGYKVQWYWDPAISKWVLATKT